RNRQRHQPGDAQPNQAAQQANTGGLDEKLQQNVAAFGADRLAHADLARPLDHGNEHDVHDADATDEQRQAGDKQTDDGNGGGLVVKPFHDLVLLVDGKIVRLAGPQVADPAHHLLHFVTGLVQVGQRASFDLNFNA